MDFAFAAVVTVFLLWLGADVMNDSSTSEGLGDDVITVSFGAHAIAYDIVVAGLFLSVRNRAGPRWTDQMKAGDYIPERPFTG